MFRKILKYDLRSIAKKWWILAVTLLCGAFPGAFLARGLAADGGESQLLTGLLGVGAVLYLLPYAILLFGSFFVTAVLLYWRFYAHFFSDEGYLTFTLPVKRRTLLLAKIANEMIWYAANLLLVCVCVLIFCCIAPPATEQYPVINPIAFQVLGQLLETLFASLINGAWVLVYIPVLLLLLLAWTLFSTCLVQCCITIGAIVAKKHKLLAGIGIFYGVNLVLSGIGQLLLTVLGSSLAIGLMELLTDATKDRINAVISLMLLLFALLFFALAYFAYALTQSRIERKLNLA